MLLNPSKHPELLRVIAGTRILEQTAAQRLEFLFNLQLKDLEDEDRIWGICGVYGPVRGRKLGGIRVKLVDQKGFSTFCNQRDLELLLGMVKPGQWCEWTNSFYPELGNSEFYGFCMDEADSADDLLDWEIAVRMQGQQDGWLQPGGVLPECFPDGSFLTFTRRVHTDANKDCEEVFVFNKDCNPNTGLGPDPSVDHITWRWSRSSKEKLLWQRV